MTDASMEGEIAPTSSGSAGVTIPPTDAIPGDGGPPAPPPISEEDSATDDYDDDDDDEVSKVRNEDEDEDDDDAGAPPPLHPSPPDDPSDALLSALSHKESGNGHFQSGDLAGAARSYRRGVNALKNLNANNGGDEQVKAVLVTLQTNLSTVTHRQGKYRVSRDVASGALAVDPGCVKALYRRAATHRALGDVDSARDDLRAALGIEPGNAAARRELALVRRAIDERRLREKAGLRRAFSSNASSLYSDKEEEERRREGERREKERLEREAVEVRKKEWEDECVKRMAR